MAKFIPKAKLSKKAAKELAKQKRVIWNISPITRKTESKKVYNRKKRSHDRYEDYGMGVFLCRSFIKIAGDVRLNVIVRRAAALGARVPGQRRRMRMPAA